MARSPEKKPRSKVKTDQNFPPDYPSSSGKEPPNQLPDELLRTEVEGMRRHIAELEASQAECKRVENELRDANKSIATILESTTDAFFALDRQWRFTYVNRQAEIILRHSRAFLIGKGIWDVFPDAIGSKFYEEYHRAVLEQRPVVFEEFYPPYNIWVEVHAYPTEDGLAVYFRDVTERRAKEQALAASEAKYRSLYDAVEAGITVIDRNARIIEANDRALEMLGMTREQMIGKTPMTPVWGAIHEDGSPFPGETHPLMIALHTGKLVNDVVAGVLRADGERRWMLVNAQPIIDQDTRVIMGAVATFIDITERKRSEEAIARLANIVESSEEAMGSLTIDGHILSWNPGAERLYGYSEEEVIGKSIFIIIPPDRFEELRRNFKKVQKGERIKPFETVRVTKDGRRIDVAVSVSPVKGRSGRIVAISWISRDITERKRAEEEVRRARDELELRVEERTQELATANERLRIDIAERQQIEESLRESEERFRALSEASFEAIAIHDQGIVLEVNETYTKIFGFKSSEVIGRNAFDFGLPPESREVVLDHVRRGVESYETVALKKDGTKFPIEVHAKPMVYHGRHVRVAAMRDITERKRYEESLRESEVRFRALSEASFEAIVIHDQGIALEVNQVYTRMFGYEPSELIGKYVLDFVLAPESREIVADYVRRGLEEPYEAVALRKDGTTFQIEVNAKPIIYQGRHVRVAAIRDITERKRYEEALRESEEKYRNIVETAQEGIWIRDAEGQTTFVNSKMAEMLGHTVDEMIGKPMFAFMDEEWRAILTTHMQLRRQGVSGQFDFKLRRKDGTDLWALVSANPIYNGEGRYVGALGMVTDITDRKQAEASLRASEERFRSIFAESPVGIELYDSEGRLIDANRACLDIFGVANLAEVRGFRLFEDPNISDEAKERLRHRETVEYQAPFDFELVKKLHLYKTSRSGTAYLDVVITPLKPKEAESVSGYLVQIQDISERKRAEEFREEYISLTSHDLRAPLTVMQGQAEWLHRLLLQKGLIKEADRTESILKSTKRMNAMIQDMVESARLESGRMEMHKVPTDLLHLVSDIAGRIGTIEGQVRVQVESVDSLPPLLVDPDRIERAVMNLVTNALKYSPPNLPVVIRVGRLGSEAFVSVTDQGIGIPPEDIPHLFERFYRASTAKEAEGLGLGLYITRLIVEAHGGRVWVESQVGKGSTFYFTLPLT